MVSHQYLIYFVSLRQTTNKVGLYVKSLRETQGDKVNLVCTLGLYICYEMKYMSGNLLINLWDRHLEKRPYLGNNDSIWVFLNYFQNK